MMGNEETINDVIVGDCECVGECPEITTTQNLSVTICEGESFTFELSHHSTGTSI